MTFAPAAEPDRGPTPVPRMQGDPSLLDPWDHTVTVTIEGRSFELPGNNTLLRLLQYLGVDLAGCRLCWNGDCDNCRFQYTLPDSHDERSDKGCQIEVVDGMCIVRLPEGALWPEDT